MSEIAIKVEGLSKRYTLGEVHSNLLSERISRGLGRIHPRLGGRTFAGASGIETRRGEFWALRGASFEVHRGDVVGIIGGNGAGKSTLLKILSRITEPTEGFAEINGRVGSLLEVGTGFHPELTGRENIFLNGAILGMKKAEIRKRFDEIVAFAEVDKFIDTPVKRYSSGMYVRLAFAVAAHLEPEILLVDEVLSVGDAQFQRKCLGKMGDVARAGRTVLFVSHNMGAVDNLCPLSVWIDKGSVRRCGQTNQVIQEYMDSTVERSDEERKIPTGKAAVIHGISCTDLEGKPSLAIRMGASQKINISYQMADRMDGLGFGIAIENQSGQRVFGINTMSDGLQSGPVSGTRQTSIILERVLLCPGHYRIIAALHGPDGGVLDWYESPAGFQVLATDMAGAGVLSHGGNGLVWLDHHWVLSGAVVRNPHDGG